MTVALPEGTYFRLRAAQHAAETAAARAEVAALRAAAVAAQAQQQFLAAFHVAAHTHDFDPSSTYRWDDAHTALVSDEAPPETTP